MTTGRDVFGKLGRIIRFATARSRRGPAATSVAVIVTAMMVAPALGQVCPSPPTVTNSQCTVTPGTIVTVAPAGTIGLNATGPLGLISGDGITVNLNAAGTTGVLDQTGSIINFNGSTVSSTATAVATVANQTGLRASSGSTINASGATINLSPMNPAGTLFLNGVNMVGAIADTGGQIVFTNSNVTTTGAANASGNHGLVATGTGSQIGFTGGSVSALISRGSFGAFAQDGGVIRLSSGTVVTTTGAQIVASQTGSHALLASGAGSQIIGNAISISTSGLLASGARAELGGTVSLTDSSITSSSTASADSDPSSAARVLSGGLLQLDGSTITTTGLRGNGFSVQDAGSQAIVSDSTITVAGTRANAAFIFNGGQASVSNSSLLSSNATAVNVQDSSSIGLTDTAIRSAGPVGYGLRVVSGSRAQP